jgi:hypothetical protein
MPAGDPGGGLSGLGGLASRIVDAMGSLLGSAADRLGDSSALDDSDVDPFRADDEHDDAEHDDAEHDDAEHDDAGNVGVPAQATGVDDNAAAMPTVQPGPVDAPPPLDPPPLDSPPVDARPAPVDAPAPAADAPTEGSTPCEIAADQLPQAGE